MHSLKTTTRLIRCLPVVLATLVSVLTFGQRPASTTARRPQAIMVHVTLAPGMPSPISGRLLIFLTSKRIDGDEIKPDEIDPHAVWVEAEEVHNLVQIGRASCRERVEI